MDYFRLFCKIQKNVYWVNRIHITIQTKISISTKSNQWQEYDCCYHVKWCARANRGTAAATLSMQIERSNESIA